MPNAAFLDDILTKATWCRREVLDSTLGLACAIAREGSEGRPIGTLFTIGRAEAVLQSSRPLILDPLAGHAPRATHIDDPGLRGTVKELAQLDGAFVVTEDGDVVAACRYPDLPVNSLRLPLGLGTRHLAAAAASRALDIIAVVVSQTGVVRVFYHGHIVAEMQPER